MVTLRAKLADASRRLADLLARYNTRHPAVVKVEAEIQDIERSIAAETQRNPGSGFDPTFNPSATVAVPISAANHADAAGLPLETFCSGTQVATETW
jgi:hypothetical protein